MTRVFRQFFDPREVMGITALEMGSGMKYLPTIRIHDVIKLTKTNYYSC